MKHNDSAQWEQYVRRQLPEREYSQMEEHLYACDDCLEVYADSVERLAPDLPSLANSANFTSEVLRRIQRPPDRLPIYRRTLFHYTAAAIITLLLMSTGTFHALLSDIDDWQHTEERQTMTERLMQRTVDVVDLVQQIR